MDAFLSISTTLHVLLALASLMVNCCSGNADSQGCEFVFAIPHARDSCSSPSIILSAMAETANVRVNISAIDFMARYTVEKNDKTMLRLPNTACISGSTGVKQETAIIRSTKPISVHVFQRPEGGDGMLALPAEKLGTTYYVASYAPDSSRDSYFAISAHGKATSIEITPPNETSNTVNVQPYETYMVSMNSDPTGTRVEADQIVSVIVGSECAQIPLSTGNCEPLLEHLPSIRQLGQTFTVGPFMDCYCSYVLRIVGVNETVTNVNVSHNEFAQLNAGEMHEVNIVDGSVIEISADKPVLVMQYMKEDGKGDPTMVFIPSIDSFSGNISFPIYDISSTFTYYINVVIECGYKSSLLYDGSAMTSWEVLVSPSGKMCILRNDVTANLHTIEHVEASFCVLVYGYNNDRGFAYPAGFNLEYFPSGEQQSDVDVPNKYPMLSTGPTQTQMTEEPSTHEIISGLYLSCQGPVMTAVFNKSVMAYTKPSDVHLRDFLCIASLDETTDNAIVTAQYPECGTSMEATKDFIIFHNSLIMSPDPESPIKQQQVDLECRVQRRHLTETNFLAGARKHVAYGNFSFRLDIYPDQTFNYPYNPEDYPIDMVLGEPLHIAAHVNAPNDFALFVEACWGTPTANPRHNTTYALISNGCVEDTSVIFFDADNSTTQSFAFNTFAFKGNNLLVYIHCQLIVCGNSNQQSRCTQGCVQGANGIAPVRKKRASRERDLHVVSTGPVVVRNKQTNPH